MTSLLHGRRILVVEDEPEVAASFAAALESIGAATIGPAASVDEALEAIERESGIDAAIVDVNLGGVMADAVADRLSARKVPFVFTSGYGKNALGERYPQTRNCHKPAPFREIEAALASAISAADRDPNRP